MRARALPLLLLFVIACGASARQKTIRLTYEAANIADDQLTEFVKIHGKALATEAHAAGKTKEETIALVDAFLAKAEHAHLTVRAVYRMVAAAAALDDERSLKALLSVAGMLKAELLELGVIKP